MVAWGPGMRNKVGVILAKKLTVLTSGFHLLLALCWVFSGLGQCWNSYSSAASFLQVGFVNWGTALKSSISAAAALRTNPEVSSFAGLLSSPRQSLQTGNPKESFIWKKFHYYQSYQGQTAAFFFLALQYYFTAYFTEFSSHYNFPSFSVSLKEISHTDYRGTTFFKKKVHLRFILRRIFAN